MDRLAKLLEMERDKPADPFLKFALAMEYQSQGNLIETRAFFKRLVADFPDYAATYYQYGKLEEAQGNAELALFLFKTGIEKAKAENDTKTVRELQQAIEMMD